MAVDVDQQSFEHAVIARSREVPVVVDFWAEWCAPCRALGPVIEAAVAARAPRIELVKLDTDANPALAQAFRIQGIPAVKAFKDGRVVSEFTGAQPRPAVEAFLDALLPSEADGLIASGEETDLRRALELEPGRADAAVALARLLQARGEDDEALAVLGNAGGSFAAQGLAARIRIDGDPQVARALALLDEGRTEEGLDELIARLAESRDERREDLRRIVVGVLDELGVDHPLARSARRKLAAALY